MPDLHTIERRIYAAEFREVPGSNGRQRWARAVTYDVVDDYGTVWLPGCFTAGLAERMPTVLYGHDWWSLEHVLGQGIDSRDVTTADEFGPPGCDVLVEFADPDQVPSARLAMTLTTPPNPVLKDVSVGFDRREWTRKDDLPPELLALGAEEAMVAALMDELSIVVRGAVPDAQMRGRRSWVVDGRALVEPEPAEPTVTDEQRAELVALLEAGDLSGVQAATARMLTNTAPDPGPPAVPVTNATGRTGVPLDAVLDLARRKAAGELTDVAARAALDLLDGRQIGSDLGPLGTIDDEPVLRRTIAELESRMADLFSSDQRAMLRDALNDRFQPGPDRWIWVVDFTDTQVVFEMEGFADSGTFMLGYTIVDNAVVWDAGEPVSVNPHTTYVPDTDTSTTAAASGTASKHAELDAEAERALARVAARR